MVDKNRAKRVIDLFHKNMERLIVKNYRLVRFFYYLNLKMTLDEFRMVALPKNIKFLYIGCGSFPWTLIILARFHKDWEFVGIDTDEGAIKNAEKIIKYFNLSNKIKIEKADGLSYDVSDFDFISVAFGVNPKKEILEKIRKSMKKDALVLVRTTWDCLNIIYGRNPIPRGFKIVNIFQRPDGIKSILLKSVSASSHSI